MPTNSRRLSLLLPWPALATLLLLGWLAYLPGLHGGFLFDDLINLDALGRRGPIDNAAAFWRYLTSGTADPTGRPLSLLTFLLDARDWPADPRPFLRTNLVLHLLNGLLLFALLRQLGRHLDGAGARTDAAALLGAGLWMLHPLLVSTTLYIVQREAMLPASFVLLGLLAYVHGRMMHAERPRAGAAWMLLGIGLGTALALLSKANGILLPLLALVLEATVLRAGDGARATAVADRLRRWRHALLVAPSLVLAVYLASRLGNPDAALDIRPWTLGERLLTQPRVLLDYLQLLAMPRVLSTGLYNDGYAASTGLLSPPATLFAMVAILALLVAALAVRRRAPVVAAGLLFWFAGHVLESTVIPLELYFEHRNYLPALLLFWPLGRAICRWRVPATLRLSVAVALLVLLAATTWQRAALWGQPQRMAQLWAAQNPHSARAQATAAIALAQSGRHAEAARALLPHWTRHPNEPQLAFNYANARCASGGLSPADVEAVASTLRHAQAGHVLVHQWLGDAIDRSVRGDCEGLTLRVAGRWLQAALDNPAMTRHGKREQNLAPLQGQLAMHHDQPDAALGYLREALDAYPGPDFAARLTVMLAVHGHPRQALALLDGYLVEGYSSRPPLHGMARVHAWILERQGYWEHEFAALRAKLVEDISQGDGAGSDTGEARERAAPAIDPPPMP
jgi:protein O-mannosyl-transferase